MRKKASEQARHNMSEAQKKVHIEGRSGSPFIEGHVVKQEWIEAGRKANLGAARHATKHTDETKAKISNSRKGKTIKENNPNWKGGITLKNKLDREKFALEIRPLVFERDNYTCQICFIRGKFIHVDHIKSWAKFENLRFDMKNCRTLCRECHYKETFGKPLPEKSTWGMDSKISGIGVEIIK
jgi:hypothetical protein